MSANVEKLRPGFLNFRLKILLALLGVVLLMAGILLLVVQRETSVQIEAAIHAAMGKSRDNFRELEKTWKGELAALCQRYSRSTRILGAFDAAKEDRDSKVLAEAAAYETKLDAISGYLLLFLDPEDRVICTLLDGRLETDTKENARSFQSVAEEEEPFGYRLYEGRLYASHTEPLYFFTRKIGRILIGFPLQEEIIQNLGEWVDGQVCFVVGANAVISTPGKGQTALLEQMVAAAGLKESRLLSFSGQTWALFSEFLNPQKPAEGSMVYAIALERTLAPFQRIRIILILTALATMVGALILGVFISRSLSAPILELVRGTERVAQGDYGFRTNIVSRDELGSLGKAFNTMVHGLFLKEKYRDVLDKVVSPEIAEEMLRGELFLGGENRIVTILFADIRGFSAMTEGMDPREVIAMMNDYLEGAGAAIEAEGGVVDKYVGDEIMAIFGAPISHADDAHRAIRAALQIQDTLRQVNHSRRAPGKPEIAIGIGINTGLAVAGNMGSKTRLNYTVLGEPVNLAARLCTAAEAGQILISASTREAAGQVWDTRVLPPVMFKGLSNPVNPWLVQGLKSS